MAVLFLLYYAVVLSLLFGPAYLALWKSRGKQKEEQAVDRDLSKEELCRAFREYAGIYQRLDRPRFNQGRLIIPSHIQLDLLLKQPYCQAVERESSTSKPS